MTLGYCVLKFYLTQYVLYTQNVISVKGGLVIFYNYKSQTDD